MSPGSAAVLPRTYLYVPGNVPEKLAKALQRGADALIIDLEDAVPLAEKDAARAVALEWLHGLPAETGAEIWVRINQGPLRDIDVKALAGMPRITGLILAKVVDAAEVAQIDAALTSAGDCETRLMPMIETASALLDARDIARGPRVHQLQVGEIDLTGDTGVIPGGDEVELATMRTMVVLASAATGIHPPVGPVSRITNDPDVLRRSTQRVKALGFMGRACIHPAQVPVVHEVFTPTQDEITDAREVIALVKAAESAGTGVVLDDEGRLVDVAVLAGARKILALAEQAGLV